MKLSKRISQTHAMLTIICILAAVILLTAALFEPKRAAGVTWVPLNESVEEALTAMDKGEANASIKDSGQEIASIKESSAPLLTEAERQTQTASNTEKNTKIEETIVAGAEEKLNEAEAADGKIDINRATAAELLALKGIGPAKAQAIINEREAKGKFSSVEDLLRVKGIGKKVLSGIEDSIVARP